MAKARSDLMKMIGLLLTLAVLTEWTALAQVSGDRNSSPPTLYKSDSYFILGAVRKPGVYQAQGRLSLFELIFMAGGLTGGHGPTAYIIRERESQNAIPGDKVESNLQDEVIQVNIAAMLKSSAPQYLEPGDCVSVSEADVFYVAGAVNAPGRFWLKEGITVQKAISLAQGLTFNARPGDSYIIRFDPATGSKQEIKVNIQNVMKGKESDIPVMPGDFIIIPSVKTTFPFRDYPSPRDLIPRGPVPSCVKGGPCIV